MDDIRGGVCALCQHNEILEANPFDGQVAVRVALRIYVCRRCGYTQWFTHDPKSLPVGDEHRTRLITKAPTTRRPE